MVFVNVGGLVAELDNLRNLSGHRIVYYAILLVIKQLWYLLRRNDSLLLEPEA